MFLRRCFYLLFQIFTKVYILWNYIKNTGEILPELPEGTGGISHQISREILGRNSEANPGRTPRDFNGGMEENDWKVLEDKNPLSNLWSREEFSDENLAAEI